MSTSMKPHLWPDDPGFTPCIAMGFLAPDWNRFMTPRSRNASRDRDSAAINCAYDLYCDLRERLRNPLELKVDGSEVEVFAEWPVLRIRLESSPPPRPPMGRRGSNQ